MKKRNLWLTLILSAYIFAGCGDATQERGLRDHSSDKKETEEKQEEDTADTTSVLKTGEKKDESADVKDRTTETAEVVRMVTPEEAESALKCMDADLDGYIWVILMEHSYDELQSIGDHIELDLPDDEKIRAAALAVEEDGVIDDYFILQNNALLSDDHPEIREYGEGYYGVSVSTEELKQTCRNLFGTEPDLNDLQSLPQCECFDAVLFEKNEEKYAVVISDMMETETDQETHSYQIRESENGYIGETEIFWGYWGELQTYPGYSNYIVSYELLPSDVSEYGLIVSSIRIERIAESAAAMNEDGNGENFSEDDVLNQPFYGIWCSAYTNSADAQKNADALTAQGLSGQVFVTTDWSNLNKERYYVVTAGTYATEEEAANVLPAVKAAGCTGAYVKYSGDYIGSVAD